VLQSIGGVPSQVLQGIASHGWLYDEVQIVALPERDVVEEDRVKLQTVLKMLKKQLPEIGENYSISLYVL